MGVEKSLFGLKPPVKLVLVDVDAVKDWVFDTNKLPVIRAASYMPVSYTHLTLPTKA